MKALILIFSIVIIAASSLVAQNSFDAILAQVEANNTTIKAARQQADAGKIEARAGRYLPDPEVEVGYRKGAEIPNGQRMDLTLSQSFDFPTAYRYRKILGDHVGSRIELTYQLQRRDILLRAELLCIDIVYRSTLRDELKLRLEQAQILDQNMQRRYQIGDATAIERNKTKLNALNTQAALEANEVERLTAIKQLSILNGGHSLSVDGLIYPLRDLPSQFDAWYDGLVDTQPELAILNREVSISETQEKLSRALALPKITLSYTSEGFNKTRAHGPGIGLSIPLWGSSRNAVRAAKASRRAATAALDDAARSRRSALRTLFDRAQQLQSITREYYTTLRITSNQNLLKKAFDKGQISLSEYILELTIYQQTIDNALATERNLQQAIAQLFRATP